MPYNYLINPFIRKQTKIDLLENVIVFDEAHNIEKQVEEAFTYDLSFQTLKKCKVYFDKLNDLIQQNPGEKTFVEQQIRLLERPILNLLEKFETIKTRLEKNLKEKLAIRNKYSKGEAHDLFQNNKLEVSLGRNIFEYFKNDMKGSIFMNETLIFPL